MMQQHGSAPQFPSSSPQTHDPSHQQQQGQAARKRKADSQDAAQNERLSKRLSLLNLEHNGSKLYVPVENPSSTTMNNPPPNTSTSQEIIHTQPQESDQMHLDDTAHKVYIYNIDDELSSDPDSEPDDGRLVFLPDIEKHLRQNRIPRGILPNSEGELAGMQMVLYSEPKALSVPEESDGVRKAVVEARRRLRERQQGQSGESGGAQEADADMATAGRDEENDADDEAMDMD